MERNGGSPATERTSDDPIAGRSSPDGGTSIIVEGMADMRIGGESAEAYPERQGVDDCEYYLRTGSCGFGERCRFNHPPDRNLAVGVMRDKGGEYPERTGQVVCQYYMRTGMCKFGGSCKYHHPRQGDELTSSLVALNIQGYPLRLGAKECTYYLRTGQCKFGAGCRFHHPQPRAVQILEPMPLSLPLLAPSVYPTVQSPAISSHQYGVVPGEWPVARSSLIPGSFVPDTYRPVMLPQGILPFPGWNPYQAPVTLGATLSAPSNAGAGPVYGITQLSSPVPTYGGAYLSMPPLSGPSGFTLKGHAFPERPGEPDCQHFMRTGDCKYGSSCKYHHPAQRSRPSTNFDLSTMGYPQRPGAPLCSQYALTGVCYFGGSCEYDHPMKSLSFSASVSSIPDMAVAPYPPVSSMPTLGTSSSLVELSAAVGSIFSKINILPQSSIQQPGQSSTPSADSSGPGSVREVHTSS